MISEVQAQLDFLCDSKPIAQLLVDGVIAYIDQVSMRRISGTNDKAARMECKFLRPLQTTSIIKPKLRLYWTVRRKCMTSLAA